jgi:sulfur relay (sulfurtransferase) DsrC/TusE family protein
MSETGIVLLHSRISEMVREFVEEFGTYPKVLILSKEYLSLLEGDRGSAVTFKGMRVESTSKFDVVDVV